MSSVTSFPWLDTHLVERLSLGIEDDKIRTALFSMQGMKALGPDGILAIFYQNQCHTVKQSLCNFIRLLQEGKDSVRGMNQAHIVLIPKVTM